MYKNVSGISVILRLWPNTHNVHVHKNFQKTLNILYAVFVL